LRTLTIYFAMHLRETRFVKSPPNVLPLRTIPIKSVTIDQYITHVADYLVMHEHTSSGSDLRSRRLSMLLAGYSMADYLGLPMRLTQKIPVTFALACYMYGLVDRVIRGYGNRLAAKAAIGLGYGLSLRPGEYLDMARDKLIGSQVCASSCFFAFGEENIVCVCDPQLYPVGQMPTAFFALLDSCKNQKRGEGGPRAMAVPTVPLGPQEFSCVQAMWNYFSVFPGVRNTLALSAHGSTVRWTDIRELCRLTAVAHNLDPSRLVPHSFRSGALAQIELATVERMRQRGGWLTIDGVRTFVRSALHHAYEIAGQLHDPAQCPLARTVVLFGDHSNETMYYAAREVEVYLGLERDSCAGM